MMETYLLKALKELALLGALDNWIEISSNEFAERIKSSQQTASRYLIQLGRNGLIERRMGLKKQMIKITSEGKELLQKEYDQYKEIFEMKDRLIFRGIVVSGMGEGKYYTIKEGYIRQFEEKLGFKPYPGTLNVKIDEIEINKLRQLKNYKGLTLNGFTAENRTFGSVKCFPARIDNKKIKCAVVLPERGHYSNIIEIVSPYYLREKFKLRDGDKIDLTIEIR